MEEVDNIICEARAIKGKDILIEKGNSREFQMQISFYYEPLVLFHFYCWMFVAGWILFQSV